MRVPKYRKHSVRDLGFVEFQGQRSYFNGAYNSTQSLAEYKKFLREHVLAESPALELPTYGVATVGVVIASFLQECRARCSKQEYEAYRLACSITLEHFGMTPAKDFGPAALKRLREQFFKARPVKRNGELVDPGRRNATRYVNAQTQRVRRAFKWAVSEELIPAWVHHGLMTVEHLATVKAKKTPAVWDDVQAVVAEVSETIGAMILTQWYTGARAKSVCHATAEQFDTTRDIWEWRPQHKTENTVGDIIIPVGPRCQKVLKPFLENAGDGFLFNPRKARNNQRYRDKYDTHSYRQAIERGIVRANAKRSKANLPAIRWTPHQLRHARGHAVRDVYGVEAAQAILGHGSISATQLYSERRLALALEVARETG